MPGVVEYLGLFLGCLVLLFTTQVARVFVFSPLRNIPGPKWAAVSDMWMLRRILQYKGSQSIQECFQKYGNIVRIGPSAVVVRRPEDFHKIYRSNKYNKAHHISRARFKDIVNITAAIDPDTHSRLRKMTNPLFSSESLKLLQTPLRHTIDNLLVHLSRSSQNHEPIDMWKFYRLFTFDFLGEAAFGQSFEALQKGENITFMEDMDKLIPALAIKMSLPPCIFNIVRHIPIPAWRDMFGAEDRLLQFARDVITKYSGGSEPGRYDMIAQLHNTTDPTSREILSEPMIASTIVSYIIAGTDTTATTMSWITWALARNPAVYARLRRELDAALPDARALPEPAALRRLPYLTAVLREGLRRWPATSLVLSRVVPPGGAEHQGHFIPENTTIGCTSYAVHRNEDIFPDPENYDPGRWLEETDGVLRLKNTPELMSSYMPWSAGSRSCQGQPLAEMELYAVIATVVRRYKIFPAPETTDETMEDVDLLVLMPKSHSVKLRFEECL